MILETSDAWYGGWVVRLSDPAYYIEDCQIFGGLEMKMSAFLIAT